MDIRTLLIIVVLLATLSADASAQSYSTIDGSIGLYCADLPDGSNMVVRVVNNKGLYTINPTDPEAEKASIIKLRKTIQKRINSLAKIKRNYDPSSNGRKLRSIYKYVLGEMADGVESSDSLDNTKPHKIYKKIGEMISLLKARLDDLQFAIETIDRCVAGEDLIPPAQSPSSEVITFTFRHPDYGDLQLMRGLGATAILHKKRIWGSLCVSFENAHHSIARFPKESEIRLVRNPCIYFFQTTFRNYPFCHYGANPDQAVAWFGSGNFGFSVSPLDEDELERLERKLAGYGKISLRAPTKKKPCRTK